MGGTGRKYFHPRMNAVKSNILNPSRLQLEAHVCNVMPLNHLDNSSLIRAHLPRFVMASILFFL